MNSKKIVAAMAASLALGLANAEEVKIGCVSGITGPLALTTADVLKVTTTYLDQVNAKGGINGNQLKLVLRDDGYDPKKTVGMVEDIVAKDHVVVLVNGAGTANTATLVKTGTLNKYKLPLLGVYSGSEAIRGPGSDQIFHTRASYNDEIMKIARHVSTIGLKRVAVFYQDDGFGADVLASLTKASQQYNFDIVLKSSYKPGERDFAANAKQLIASKPQAILLMGVPEAVYRFMKVYDAPTGFAQLYALSFVSPKGLAEFAGEEKVRGIGISQVVPNPNSSEFALSREFKNFMQTPSLKGITPSPFLFEAYLNIRLAVEAIKLSGPHPTPEKVTQSLSSMHDYKLAGYPIDFTSTNRRGSSYLDIAVVGVNARLSY
ncbi:ABC transporter substrate-binding protein [Noviherbaspirillum sp.]|uniref:ABC transporter substrate-binding protein n=1 Tax=Noviherbaspirillum sp. TaxID=1926288 RepID=UPI002B4772FD|nr:ABC transporter substrate-binding protein [Noviherbaspirillum sp.]HJV80058.1 ABC transporter substrate-binding protein [Noviherbaspirillum sp.]